MHIPPVFAFTEAILFWIAMVWAFAPEFVLCARAARHASNPQDAGTLRLIDAAGDAAHVLAFLLAFLPWLAIPFPRLALYAGTILLIAGSVLRRYCFRLLGRYFTGAVIVTPGQPVIDTGPYRWVRHPGYLAAFIMYLGMGLALGSGLSLAVLELMACYVYGRRIRAEEKALLETIGEPYRAYMKRTKRLLPFVF